MNQEVEKTKKNKRPAAAAFVRSFVRPFVRFLIGVEPFCFSNDPKRSARRGEDREGQKILDNKMKRKD